MLNRSGGRPRHQTILPTSPDLCVLDPLRLLFLPWIRRAIHLSGPTANGSRILYHNRRFAGVDPAASVRRPRRAVREYMGDGTYLYGLSKHESDHIVHLQAGFLVGMVGGLGYFVFKTYRIYDQRAMYHKVYKVSIASTSSLLTGTDSRPRVPASL